jgi:hypothetical protein
LYLEPIPKNAKVRNGNFLKSAFVVVLLTMCSLQPAAQFLFIDTAKTLSRSGRDAEWEEFAERFAHQEKIVRFNISNAGQVTYFVSFIQYDVKQNWRILLNDTAIGLLPADGNAMRVYFDLPSRYLLNGVNTLKIKQDGTVADDIVISDMKIEAGNKQLTLSRGLIRLAAVENGATLPIRFTVTDMAGILQSTGTTPADSLAVRPGMIYAAGGKAEIFLPEGKFKIYATRGFEYNVDSVTVTVRRGDNKHHVFTLVKEVETKEWISMDPHIHTLTYSGHGDATAMERVITIAGEGVETAIVTEHNKIVDYGDPATKLHLEKYFTLIAGDEVTTSLGHFNFFPLDSTMDAPGYRVKNWLELKEQFSSYHSPVIILNHGRDIHNGFRPFEFLEKNNVENQSLWPMPANAMEIINSGALLSDPMLLINDWFKLLKEGKNLTPVGASDSHDVGRYIVGQARTYVKTGKHSPATPDVPYLLQQIKKGNVSVSFGLMAEIELKPEVGSASSARDRKTINIGAVVKGPSWTKAGKVTLYANGNKIREELINAGNKPGIKWEGEWEIERPVAKTFYVVLASGDYEYLPYWPVVKAFQPVSKSWKPYVMGVSGALWTGGK